jgi:urease accessory protein
MGTRMARVSATIMGIESSGWLGLAWLASPALPIGGFSYSEGLEAAVEHGLVHDEASCSTWLRDQMLMTQARGDWAVVALAIEAWRALDSASLGELAHWVSATRESAEMRLQSEQMGRSLTDWLRNLSLAPPAAMSLLENLPPSYPMTLALALSLIDAPLPQAMQSCAFSWAENMVQAAVKSVPLGQNAGQRLLLGLVQAIPEAVQKAIDCPAAQRQCFSPMLAILSARHESQYSRLFRS